MKKTELNRNVATNVRIQRIALGWSQEKLAHECGLHRTYVGAVERCERNITLDTLQRIAKALKCTPESLISKEGGS